MKKYEQFGNSVFKFDENDWSEEKSKEFDKLKIVMNCNKVAVALSIIWIFLIALHIVDNPGPFIITASVILCITNDIICVCFSNKCEKFNTPIFNFLNKLYKSKFVCSVFSNSGLFMIVDNKGEDEKYDGYSIANTLGIDDVEIDDSKEAKSIHCFAMYDLSESEKVCVTIQDKNEMFVDFKSELV